MGLIASVLSRALVTGSGSGQAGDGVYALVGLAGLGDLGSALAEVARAVA